MSVIRTPFSDITGGYYHAQSGHRCSDFELNAMECVEAAGAKHAQLQCKDYLDDWMECKYMNKQFLRRSTMREKRVKEFLKGNKKYSDIYEKPPASDPYL